jgi:hypothetical protein
MAHCTGYSHNMAHCTGYSHNMAHCTGYSHNFISSLLTKYHMNDQIRRNEMGGACSTMGVREEVHTGIWWGDLKEKDHVEDTGVDGMTLLKLIFKKWDHVSTNTAYQPLNLAASYC